MTALYYNFGFKHNFVFQFTALTEKSIQENKENPE
jgi:hypothetical protein